MKKLFRNIALLLLPILLYYGVFLAFEPNNFFGLRPETPSGAVFGAIKDYQRHPQSKVIVGDSRLAHLDMDEAEAAAGVRYANLAFGGAGLKEMLDLTDWLLARYPQIDEVVLGLSFYNMNENYTSDRFDTIETALYNPFAYLTSLSYNLEAVQNLGFWLGGQPLGGGESETIDPADYEYADYAIPATGEVVRLRTEFGKYLSDIAPYTSIWQPNTEQFDRLVALIGACAEKGVRFVVALPPAHSTILEYDMRPRGIEAEMLGLIDRLNETPALVLDYEVTGRLDFADDQYYDGFHLDYLRGLPQFTEKLFTDIRDGLKEGDDGA